MIKAIITPEMNDPGIMAVRLFKQPGDIARPPFDNADRPGYVMAVGKTQADAESLAESFVSGTQVLLED